MSKRWERVIRCEDLADRERVMRVLLTGNGRVAIVVPAGETAILSPRQVRDLRDALKDALPDAAVEAYQQGGRS